MQITSTSLSVSLTYSLTHKSHEHIIYSNLVITAANVLVLLRVVLVPWYLQEHLDTGSRGAMIPEEAQASFSTPGPEIQQLDDRAAPPPTETINGNATLTPTGKQFQYDENTYTHTRFLCFLFIKRFVSFRFVSINVYRYTDTAPQIIFLYYTIHVLNL